MSFDLILPFLRPIEPLLLDESVSEIMGNPDIFLCKTNQPITRGVRWIKPC